MQTLTAVEEARRLFTEAKDWSVWRWLSEKKRARTAADAAWVELEAWENEVRAAWPAAVKTAWRDLEAGKTDRVSDPHVRAAVKRYREADQEAYQLRMTAEATFDEADRRRSIPLARKGTEEALTAWEQREKLIHKAEKLGRG